MNKIKSFFTKKRKKQLLIIFSLIFTILLVGGIYGMSIRKGLLDKAVAKVKEKLKEEYALDLQFAGYGFSGLSAVEFTGVIIDPDTGATLLKARKMEVGVKIWPLLFKEIQLAEVNLDQAFLSLVKEGTRSNYDFIFRKKKSESVDTTVVQKRNLAQLADRVIKEAFDKIPSNMNLDNVEFSYQDSSGTQRIRVPSGTMRGGSYDIDIYLNENDAKWTLTGKIDRGDQELKLTVSSEKPEVELPVLKHKFGLSVSFDAITFDLKEIKRHGNDQLKLSGEYEVKNLIINHRRLSDKKIVLPNAAASGAVLVSENTLELVDANIEVRDFSFSPKLKYIHAPSKQLELSVHTGKFKAQDFFDAIPHGLFETLDGIEVDGMIDYNLDFKVDFDRPHDLQFSSVIDDKDLKIKTWGKANIAALNGTFVHEVYEDTTKSREILVGEGPNFTPLGQIAPVLQKTVLNTEDPFFYGHKGFEEEAFKLSIVTNIREKAFKRGASTISMQLIKNLFLHRNKTMIRKFEEILLVWLMEQSDTVSKERLLEIYFNIIEWGRGVYGIKEASNYYFGKTPTDINLGESLFLSSIIPRPKTGLSSFDYTGHLKPWVQRHFNTYGSIMLKLNQLNGIEVPENFGFYGVVLQPNLRPARPAHLESDSSFMDFDFHRMLDQIDVQEEQRRLLLERMINKDSHKINQD